MNENNETVNDKAVTIWALDDHHLILEGYEVLLKGVDQISYTRRFSDASQLMEDLKSEQPDVLLMDIHLGTSEDGVKWCKRIKNQYKDLSVLGISTFNEVGMIKAFVNSGGKGFVLKTIERDELVHAIREVYKGNYYFSRQLQNELLDQTLFNLPSNRYVPQISEREKEVLELIAEENTTAEIADKLFLSVRTVESHRTNLIQKFGVRNVAGLIREAVKFGFVK